MTNNANKITFCDLKIDIVKDDKIALTRDAWKRLFQALHLYKTLHIRPTPSFVREAN